MKNFTDWLFEVASYTTKEQVKEWLDHYRIEKYTINDDLSVDVEGNVYLLGQKFIGFPVQFNKVNGNFIIERCVNLISLKGSPRTLNGNFDCRNCRMLVSLEYAPSEINGNLRR